MGYFKTWRRQFGVVTLVTACMFMVGWVRSTSITDEVLIPTWNHSVAGLMSSGHSLLLITQVTDGATNGDYPPCWMAVDSNENLMNTEDIKWSWRKCGFGVGEWSLLELGNPSSKVVRVIQTYRAFPYWSIVLPLTLLSAYLLLRKPRMLKQPEKPG